MTVFKIKLLNEFSKKEKLENRTGLLIEIDNDDIRTGQAVIMEEKANGNVWSIEFKQNGKITSILQMQ